MIYNVAKNDVSSQQHQQTMKCINVSTISVQNIVIIFSETSVIEMTHVFYLYA